MISSGEICNIIYKKFSLKNKNQLALIINFLLKIFSKDGAHSNA